MKLKLIYEGREYPYVEYAEETYECLMVLIPEPTGDYFLASIDSLGTYALIECVGEREVEIKCDE